MRWRGAWHDHFQERTHRLQEALLGLLQRNSVGVSLLGHEVAEDLRAGGSRQHGVDGDARTRDRFGKPARDRDAELQASKRSTPLEPAQPAAPVAATEAPRAVPRKADLYADPGDMHSESDHSAKDRAEALALAREQAGQRAREEAIRLQQDAKERRMRPQRKPK